MTMPGHEQDEKKAAANIPLATVFASREALETDVLFQSIGEGVLFTNEQGNISRMNDIGLDILGFSAEELVGKWHPEALVAEEENGRIIPNIERPVTEAFLTGKPVFRRMYYRRRDGSRVPVALTVSPVVFKNRPIGAIEVFRDISEEVELEKSKDEFISIASHQLRTPATVVKQYIGMLLDGYMGPLTDEQRNMLQTAFEYNDNQLDIITDLLRIAQADANKITMSQEQIDLVKLTKDVIESQLGDYKRNKLKLVLKSTPGPIICKADPLHIRMVLENLINNANKYSPQGGAVVVAIAPTLKFIKISVQDEGIGIAAKDLPKLFQKFSRIDNPSSHISGSGLGLYWVKKLISLHNGTISVKSKLGAGTVFTVQLPRGDDE